LTEFYKGKIKRLRVIDSADTDRRREGIRYFLGVPKGKAYAVLRASNRVEEIKNFTTLKYIEAFG